MRHLSEGKWEVDWYSGCKKKKKIPSLNSHHASRRGLLFSYWSLPWCLCVVLKVKKAQVIMGQCCLSRVHHAFRSGSQSLGPRLISDCVKRKTKPRKHTHTFWFHIKSSLFISLNWLVQFIAKFPLSPFVVQEICLKVQYPYGNSIAVG